MASEELYYSFTWLGLIMMVLGIIFFLIPYAIRYAPEIQKLPPLLLYIYHRDNLYFATSPILIIISLIWFLLSLFSRYTR